MKYSHLFPLVMAAIILFTSSPAFAQWHHRRGGDQFFPPQDCVAGQTNILSWQGPGTPTRCLQIPICVGDGQLQFNGSQFTCSSTPTPPPCLGDDCGPIPSPGHCLSSEANWSEGTSVCAATLPEGNIGQRVTVQSNNPADFTGSARYRCVGPTENPHWEFIRGTCQGAQSVVPTCPSVAVQWQVGNSPCAATLPETNIGQTVTVQSNNPVDFAGSATYRCMSPPGDGQNNLAQWTLLSADCRPGTPLRN